MKTENKKINITKIVSVLAVIAIGITSIAGIRITSKDLSPANTQNIAIVEEVERKETVKEKKKFFAKFSPWSLLSIPMWICAFLLSAFFKPLIGKIAVFLFLCISIFLIMLVSLKAIYPEKSLKELLTKRNIICYICTCIIFAIAFMLPDIISINQGWQDILVLILGTVCSLLMIRFCD